MPSETLRTLGKVGGLLLLPFALILIPTAWLEGHRSLCVFRNLTGKPCPGCGMTRAFSSAFHGDFQGAYHYNKRVVIVLPILAYTWVRTLTTEYRRLRALTQRDQR